MTLSFLHIMFSNSGKYIDKLSSKLKPPWSYKIIMATVVIGFDIDQMGKMVLSLISLSPCFPEFCVFSYKTSPSCTTLKTFDAVISEFISLCCSFCNGCCFSQLNTKTSNERVKYIFFI